MPRPKYRMFVDEFGDTQTKRFDGINRRYLSVSGLMVDRELASMELAPDLDQLKESYFEEHDPDDPVILHRVDIVKRRGAFRVLNDRSLANGFDQHLFSIIRGLDFRLSTVTIDKQAHCSQYSMPAHPYHYVMECLVERFVWFLNRKRATGDIMVESRNQQENHALQAEYERIYDNGSAFATVKEVRDRLSSRQLKFKTKEANVAGLQIVDLLCKPSFDSMLCTKDANHSYGKIDSLYIERLEATKYFRSRQGQIDNYGRKWLG